MSNIVSAMIFTFILRMGILTNHLEMGGFTLFNSLNDYPLIGLLEGIVITKQEPLFFTIGFLFKE